MTNRTNKTKGPRVSMIPSIRALARELDRPSSTVALWAKRGDWSFGKPPWPKTLVATVREWIATIEAAKVPQDASTKAAAGDDPAARKHKINILAQRSRLLKMRADQQAGLMVGRTEIEQRTSEQIRTTVRALMDAGRVIGDRLSHVADRIVVEGIVTEELKRVCDAFANGLPYGRASGGDEPPAAPEEAAQ